ncbi:NUDIX hydrolase [Candidatus Saccharibacteria bacterium]|nr:NUDIX hydrolase [Candidatus Saccharibacteria bacterium]
MFKTELWFDGQSEVTFVPSATLPEDTEVSAVKVFDIADDEVLLVEVPEKGGWDIPGGHVENGEQPEYAVIREVAEETGGSVNNLKLFGYLMLKKVVESDFNKDYPDVSLIAMYSGDIISEANTTDLMFESTQVGYFSLNQVAELSPFWTPLSDQILEYASDISSTQ